MPAIRHVLGDERRRTQAFIADTHYTHTHGGSGRLTAVFDDHGTVVGGCLIGPLLSLGAERTIVAPPVRPWMCKRLVCADTCTVPESQLLWFALRQEANMRGQTFVAVSYADPCARDSRTGLPLAGRLYLASNHFFAGTTSQQRTAVFDTNGCVRSPRQGNKTLHAGTLPPGWRIAKIPPARIWIAVVVPTVLTRDGIEHETTSRWRRNQWLNAWRLLNPTRRIAAKQWVSERAWSRYQRSGVVALGEPSDVRLHERRQAAWWGPGDICRNAAPVWVAPPNQLVLPIPEDERTAHRTYKA